MAQGDFGIYTPTANQNVTTTTFTELNLAGVQVQEGDFSDASAIIKNLPDSRVIAINGLKHDRNGGSNRTDLEIAFNFNGAEITTGRSSGYIRRSGGADETYTAGAVILPSGSGNTVRLTARRRDSQTATIGHQIVSGIGGLQLLEIGNVGAVYNAIANVAKNTASIVNGNPLTFATLNAGTWADVDWDVEAEVGTGFTTVGGAGGSEIQVPASKLFLTFGLDGNNTSASARRNLVAKVQVRDGSGGTWADVDYSFCTAYLRGSNGSQDMWANWFGIIDVSGMTDPRVRVQFIEESEAGSRTCSYQSAYIQMLELPDTAELIRIDDLTADNASITTTFTDVSYGTSVEEDGDAFGRSGNTIIEMAKAEKYMFFSQFCARRTAVDATRKEPQGRFFVGGSEITGAHGRHSNYSRGDQSTTSTLFAGRAGGILYDNSVVDTQVKVQMGDELVGTTDGLQIDSDRMAIQGVNIPSLFATAPNPALETLQDNFDDASLDGALWQDYLNGGSGSVTEQNGRLEIISPTSTTQATGVYAVQNYSFDETSIHAEVIHTPTTDHEFWFGIYTGGDYCVMGIQPDGTLIGGKAEPSYSELFSITYNATDHRWLRMRETSDTIYWETSPDGITWTVRHSVSHAIDFSTCWCEFYLYGSTPAGTALAYVDNVNLGQVSITKPLTYAVKSTASAIQKALQYVVHQATAITKSLQYEITTVGGTCLAGWTYRKTITIAGSVDGAQTDYQVMFRLEAGSGTDSGNTIYLNNHAETDFDDIRFTASNGSTELDHHITRRVNGSYCEVWVKIPSIPADPSTMNIVLQYGNSGASSASDIKNTFVRAIDPDVDTPVDVSSQFESGQSFATNTVGVNNILFCGQGNDRGNVWKSYTIPSIVFTNGGGLMLALEFQSISGEAEICAIQFDDQDTTIDASRGYQFDGTQAWGGRTMQQYTRDGSMQTLEQSIDINYTATRIFVVHDNDAGGNDPTNDTFNNIRIRKYTANEPSVSSVGTEETCGGAPVTTSIEKSMTYEVTSTPSAVTKPMAYAVKSSALVQKSMTYEVRTIASAIQKAMVYVVRSATNLQLTMTYMVTETPSAITKAMEYAVKSSSVIQKTLTYAVTDSSAIQKTLNYAVRSKTAIQLPLEYQVTTESAPISKPLVYQVRTDSVIQHTMAYEVNSEATLTKPMNYRIKSVQGQTKAMQYAVKVVSSITKSMTYVLGGGQNIQLPLVYRVKSSSAVTKAMQYVVARFTGITKPMAYAVKVTTNQTKQLAYTVRQNTLVQKAMEYVVTVNDAIVLPMTYRVKSNTTLQLAMQYVVEQTTGITKSMTYLVRSVGAIALPMVYTITDAVGITKPMVYAVKRSRAIHIAMSYDVVQVTAIQLPMKYVITKCRPYHPADKVTSPIPSPFTAKVKTTTPKASPYAYQLKPYTDVPKCDA
jgi:hypothetical protein